MGADIGYEEISFLDDNSPEAIGKIAELNKFRSQYSEAFVDIGNNKRRSELLCALQDCDYIIPTLMYSSAYVSRTARIGQEQLLAESDCECQYCNWKWLHHFCRCDC